ncbi:adenylate/guanylate cyclase domain-containing protein [bacterium]|nr:adenylate/guanylate cyclase domain-containing protein [bacterium]
MASLAPTRHRPALLLIGVMATLLCWPLLEGSAPGTFLCLKARDGLLCLRYLLGRAPPVSDRIVLLAIDDATVREPLLQKPLSMWGAQHAQVLSALREAGAAVVVMDIIQPYPGANEREDKEFARAVRDGPSVLAVDIDDATSRLAPTNPRLLFAAGDPAEVAGLVRMARDSDGLLRRASLVHGYTTAAGGRDNLLTLWFQGARRLLGVSTQQFAQAWQARRGEQLQLGERNVPLVSGAPGQSPEYMLVNYLGPDRSLPRISYSEVLRRSQDRQWLRQHFQGRLVFMGVTVADLQDYHLTPMGWVQRPSASSAQPPLAGVLTGRHQAEGDRMAGTEVLAQAANTLLTGAFLRLPPSGLACVYTLAFAWLGVLAGYSRGRRLPSLLALLLANPLLALGALLHSGWLMPLAWPGGSILVAFAGATGWRYKTTEADRRRMRALLSRYVSDRVASLVVDHPEEAGLGGRSAEVTLLFSDLNQFTTWSEKTEPAQVIEVMNEYFTAMEEVIFHHGGTLKQFVGDEIMVIFGAPYPQPDAEERAVRTALAMRSELDRLGEVWCARGGPRLQAKYGLHRGRVVVGNVGSPHRTEYAAVGDAVNLASRVMGLTKLLGHQLLITEDVYVRVRELVQVSEFPAQPIRGRQASVIVFGLDGLSPQARPWAPAERN